MNPPITRHLIKNPIEAEHLTIEMVHGADPEVSELPYPGKGSGAVIDTLHQGIYG